MPRKSVWISLAACAVLIGAAAAFAAFAWRELNSPLTLPADGALVQVANGASLRGVTAELAERDVLENPWLLTGYARATGEAMQIKFGEYQVAQGTTPLSLLAKLVAGDVYLHQVTIIEGSRFADALAGIRAHPAIAVGSLDAEGIMTAIGAPGVHPEGQFFPDTYRFARGTTDVDILRLAHEALVTRLDAAWRSRSADIAVDSEYEALIVASIIEKETAVPAERPLIAGVVHERLRRNMRLQVDPTVIYGLGDAYDGNLRRQDMDSDTPYNTYTRGGLPPTPIALPGAGAIEAAVSPEITGAVYYVATGRDDGSHSFSKTYEEHERALREYLRVLRSREQ